MRLGVAWLERTLRSRVAPAVRDDLDLWLSGDDKQLLEKHNEEARSALVLAGGEIG